MNQKLFLPALLSLVVPATTGLAATKVSIADAITACEVAGIKPSAAPVQSKWKQDSSLIGMAYLNFIYQNDLGNPHFCQSMLLMHSQVPAGTANPFVRLFDAGRGDRTMPVLQDIQLLFDYSIARTDPPVSKLQVSLRNIMAAL